MKASQKTGLTSQVAPFPGVTGTVLVICRLLAVPSAAALYPTCHNSPAWCATVMLAEG